MLSVVKHLLRHARCRPASLRRFFATLRMTGGVRYYTLPK
jgi:hypothetical protein